MIRPIIPTSSKVGAPFNAPIPQAEKIVVRTVIASLILAGAITALVVLHACPIGCAQRCAAANPPGAPVDACTALCVAAECRLGKPETSPFLASSPEGRVPPVIPTVNTTATTGE